MRKQNGEGFSAVFYEGFPMERPTSPVNRFLPWCPCLVMGDQHSSLG
jgi:hypothetical protein